MPLTNSLVTLADTVVQMLQNNSSTLGLADVCYGDQQRIHVTPLACVEPDAKNTNLKGAPRTVDRIFTIYVLLYHAAVTSPQVNRRDADVTAEAVETLLNSDAQMGGLVIHSMVENLESGYVTRNNTLFRASRITFRARSMDRLPNNL